MKQRIALILSDVYLANTIVTRLAYLLKNYQINHYLPSTVLSGCLRIAEEVILYDQLAIEKTKLLAFLAGRSPPIFIPLRKSTKSDEVIPADEILEQITLSASQLSNHLSVASQTSPPQESTLLKSHIRIITALGEHSQRKVYLRTMIKALLQPLNKVIHLEIMSGLHMLSRAGTTQNISGNSSSISSLLLYLENNKCKAQELWNFLQVDCLGCYFFGLPEKADDLLLCSRQTVEKLLQLLHRLTTNSPENIIVLVSIASLPLQVFRSYCNYGQELHLLLPADSQDISFYQKEIHNLVTNLPSHILKFICTPRGRAYEKTCFSE